MFFTKRKKIESWLKTAAPSPFAALLAMERSGQMASHLSDLGLTKQEYHIDWLNDYKCISLQARFDKLYVDIQIEQDAFTIAMDEDEPDEPQEFPLSSSEDFFKTIRSCLSKTI